MGGGSNRRRSIAADIREPVLTLSEFEQQVFAAAMASAICGIPAVRRLTATSINLRVNVTPDGFVDAFTVSRRVQRHIP
jgi:hypothetical protein